MNALPDTSAANLAQYRAPRCPRGLFAFDWHTDIDEAIVCHLEYEAAEEAQHYGDAPYPGYPESITLCAAYLRGIDILPLLSDAQIDLIEGLALEEVGEVQW